MSDEFNIKDQHVSLPHSILTRYVSKLAKVIDKFRNIDRSFNPDILDSGIRYSRFNMAVDEYKFDIFTPTYEVKLHYEAMNIKYLYNYENGYVVNMHITPTSWDCLNIVPTLCALKGFIAFLCNILESSTTEDFKIADDNCITVVTKDEILYLSSAKNNNNEDVKLYKKLHNMIHSLLNDELSIRKNVRGVYYEDGVYTIRLINNYVMRYYKYINLLHIRSSDSSDLYTILDRIEEV